MEKDKQKEREKNSRQFQTLKRNINGLLKDFEKNKQWADFSNWLHRLHEELANRKFDQLPQQTNLCKRLAQCLNPSLPAGVHTTVLKVYQVILKNFSTNNKTELLPLIALGLFPFFQHSNSQNKIILLKLFDDHFVCQTEVVQMAVGLMNALLTGLNQNSEDLARRIYGLCDKINRSYGRLWVDGAVWINILKSPKVRLAGFKYFMKVFKDRDRLLANPSEDLKVEEEPNHESRIQAASLNEQQKILLVSLLAYRTKPDDHLMRFPNFSSLIVNTLCVCLSPESQAMIKRSALDLLITYLKLGNRSFGAQEGIELLQKMLLLLQSRQYNLTNRVYKYLFDQPNSEGQFHIDFEKKAYELDILNCALSNLLSKVKQEAVLLIIDILTTDHPTLAEPLLRNLSFQIIFFIRQFYVSKSRRQKSLTRAAQDFYLGVVTRNKKIFLESIISRIAVLQQSADKESKIEDTDKQEITTILDVLQFYFNKLQKLNNFASRPKRKGSLQLESESVKQEDIKEFEEYQLVRTIVLRELITYLFLKKCRNQKEALAILDLCNQLSAEFAACGSGNEAFSPQEASYVEDLLQLESKKERKTVFAKLITLCPNPRKEQLLPYIQDSSLSIICINILLGGDRFSHELLRTNTKKSSLSSSSQKISLIQPIPLTTSEQQQVFRAIFKLLNCHLFQARALEFIERFRLYYSDSFGRLIDQVEPSQWLIYWKKVQGNVSGGIIRMIQNIDSRNSYHQHLSRKWITQAESIISKVIQPIYNLMDYQRRSIDEDEGKNNIVKQWNIDQHEKIYRLMQLVFKATTINFSKFFFLQRDKYLNPFILFIFKCLETDTFDIKSRSLQILTFLLAQTRELQQKYDIVTHTLPNVLSILERTIDSKNTIEQIIFNKTELQSIQNQNQELLLMSNLEIQLLQFISKIVASINQLTKGEFSKHQDLIRLLRNANTYDIVLKGMVCTNTPYIKTLYFDSCRELVEMVSRVDRSKAEVTTFMTKVLDRLFVMLKNTDMNTIEEIIKGRNLQHGNMKQSLVRRKRSYSQTQQPLVSIYKESIQQQQIKHNLNLQEKYGEIIELWNSIKFYIQFAIRLELREMPVINLLSLILQSFPFSYLKYTTSASPTHTASVEELEEEIGNVTGLKKEVLQIFEILWNKQSRQILDFLIEKGDPRILVHSSLDPSRVLQTFNKSAKLREVIKYHRSGRISLPRNTLHYNLQVLLNENQLFYFIYVYLLYCNLRLLKGRRISIFFDALIEFLALIKATPHIQTKFWLLQLLELVAQRISNSKELAIENWHRIRLQLQSCTKEVLDETVAVITRSKLFTHKQEIKNGLFNLFSKEEKESSLFDFVKIFPPSIFQSYERYKNHVKKMSENRQQASKRLQHHQKHVNLEQPRQRLNEYILQQESTVLERQNQVDQFLFSQFLNRHQNQYIDYLSICGLKTLIRIGNSLLINIYEKDLSKINIIIREILMNLLPICQNRLPENQHFNELIAEYLHTVLDHDQLRPEIVKGMRKSIVQVFMANDFFKCTQKTLAHWRAVIDYSTQNYDLLSELLSKEGLFEGIFTKKAESMRQKIKSFERVCFIIYSGKVDKYENRLRTVLESLNEVMKQENPSPALLVLILFCIRILLMRLSALSLNKLFRSVWPSLITLLIQIFRRDRAIKSTNLQLAALKVIELIHALQLQEFMLHKWMFVFDYFGLRIDPMGQIEDNMAKCEILTPFSFKPFLTNALPNNRFRCKFLPEKPEGLGGVRRRLIVKRTNISSEEDLKQCTVLLMQYIMDLNQCRCEISKDEIQGLIEEDFISLDDYIFKMK